MDSEVSLSTCQGIVLNSAIVLSPQKTPLSSKTQNNKNEGRYFFRNAQPTMFLVVFNFYFCQLFLLVMMKSILMLKIQNTQGKEKMN